MSSSTKQLYLFLTACSGNWRNSIYIKCQSEKDDPGYLLAVDRDGQPVIWGVQQFYQLTGVWIAPAECCGQLTEIGVVTACFPLRLVMLGPDFVVLGCCPVRCLRAVISCSGSRCGSARKNHFLLLTVDSSQLRMKLRNIFRHGIPYDPHIHTIVPMYNTVPQTVDLFPGNTGNGLFCGIT